MLTVLKTARALALHVIVCGLVFFAWVGRDSIVAAQSTDARVVDAATSPGAHRGPEFRDRARATNAAPRAPVVVGSNEALREAQDPEEITDDFLDQNQKLVEAQLKSLKEEAEKLRARLTKVEAGVMRLDHVLEAIKQGRGAAASAVPPSQGVFPDVLSYFLQPFESTIPPPEGAPHLEGKKVVILCEVTPAAAGEYPSLDRDIPPMLADILRKNVKKITVVDPDKVHIQVFELDHPRNSGDTKRKESRNLYDGYTESTFPNRGPLPIDSGNSRSAFARVFAKIVVKEISWHFIEHLQEDTIQNSTTRSDRPETRDEAPTTSKRVAELIGAAERLSGLADDWEKFWLLDQPSHMTPFKTHGGNVP
jgi:hypothetical protein